MTTKIGIIADTRIKDENEHLPKKFMGVLEGVDLIIHAGNICLESVLIALEQLAPVEAIKGALDNPEDFKRELPGKKILSIEGYNIGVYNEKPSLESIKSEKIDILISGNTCIPKIDESKEIRLSLDPGSPTQPAKFDQGTMILLKLGKMTFSYIIRV